MMASGRILRMDYVQLPETPLFLLRLQLIVNGREKEGYSVTIPRNRHSAARRFSTPLELVPDDRINFRSASGNPNVISAVVSLLIQLDM